MAAAERIKCFKLGTWSAGSSSSGAKKHEDRTIWGACDTQDRGHSGRAVRVRDGVSRRGRDGRCRNRRL